MLEESVFKLLLALDTIRGPHSTGVLVVPDTKVIEPKLVKKLGTPWELFADKEFTSAMLGRNKLLLGHNRWATKGAVTVDNAHPFKFSKVIGAHNGTLKSQYMLKDSAKFVVDSENIYHNINEDGVKNTIPKLDGSFALTYYNVEDDTLNFVRNEERPLFYCYTIDGSVMFWASEAWMLQVATSKNKIECGEIFQVSPLTLYTFELANIDKLMTKPRVSKVEEYIPPVYNRGVNNLFLGRGGYGDDQYHEEYGTGFRKAKAVEAYNRVQPKVVTQIRTDEELLKESVGTTINFISGGAVYSTSKSTSHIRGIAYINGKASFNVKVFPKVNSEQWRNLSEIGGRWSGRVTGFSTKSGGFALMDAKGLTLIPIAKPKDVEPPKVIRLVKLPEEQEYIINSRGIVGSEFLYRQKVSKGCCVCGIVSGMSEHKELVWILNDEEYICHGCSDTDIAKQYARL